MTEKKRKQPEWWEKYEKSREEHPSYGMVQISRVSGHTNLFGSAMRHQNFFALRVQHGLRRHDLGRDSYSAADCVPIVEIYLSPAQFVEMITTMNIGSGVPCTINRIGAESIEDCPDQITEGERIRNDFKNKVEEQTERLREAVSEAESILSKDRLNKSDREDIRGILHRAMRLFNDSAPFAADQFDKATDRLTAQAKCEIESFITTAIHNAGIKALSEGDVPPIEIKEISEGGYQGKSVIDPELYVPEDEGEEL